MIRYVPFLKAKRGELTAMAELAPEVRQAICPFFDFPRKKAEYTAETFAGTAQSIVAGLKKHWGSEAEFYFDDLDINQKLTLDGEPHYAYILKALQGLQVIPVVALDRTSHNAVVAQLKRDGEIASETVAFRADHSDFENFDNSEDQIDYDLASVFSFFDAIDLILDCRLCTGIGALETAAEIANFARRFCAAYGNVRRVIVTGSSLPASIGDVLSVDSSKVVERRELTIIARARNLSDVALVAGDYTMVSPFYSDADLDPKIMQNVMTPRLIYPFKECYYVRRGVSMKSGGQTQYILLTRELCGQNFFRPGYSSGESYF
jgi:hypothetical protein